METIGYYTFTTVVDNQTITTSTPLLAEPGSATLFAIIGWLVVLAILFYAIYKWSKKPSEVAKKP